MPYSLMVSIGKTIFHFQKRIQQITLRSVNRRHKGKKQCHVMECIDLEKIYL